MKHLSSWYHPQSTHWLWKNNMFAPFCELKPGAEDLKVLHHNEKAKLEKELWIVNVSLAVEARRQNLSSSCH